METTDDLINKSFRHVSLTFTEPLSGEEAQRFERLEGVDEFRKEDSQVSFDLHGNLDRMIKLAARHELVDMRYERPSLEEIFFAYYGGNGGNHINGAKNTTDRGNSVVSKDRGGMTVAKSAGSVSYHPGRNTSRTPAELQVR